MGEERVRVEGNWLGGGQWAWSQMSVRCRRATAKKSEGRRQTTERRRQRDDEKRKRSEILDGQSSFTEEVKCAENSANACQPSLLHRIKKRGKSQNLLTVFIASSK